MIEVGTETNIALATVLVGMGVYFLKSSQLPSHLKQIAQGHGNVPTMLQRAFAHKTGKVMARKEKILRNNKIKAKNEINNNKMNVQSKMNANNSHHVKENMNARREQLEQLLAKELEAKMNQARLMQKQKQEARELSQKMNQVKQLDLVKLYKRIDQITLAIMTLEMELKDNNSKNNEIQSQIDVYLNELEKLNSRLHA